MLDTVWRLAEKDFEVDGFLNEFHLNEFVAVAFHKGERKSRNHTYGSSGFNISVSNNTNSRDNVREINEFIIRHKKAFEHLSILNINSVIDIGCTVGTADQFMKSVNISTELLGTLNALNVSLEFSAYPASDEENEI